MADHKVSVPFKEDLSSAREQEPEIQAEEPDCEPQISPMPDVLEPCPQPETITSNSISNSASSASSTTNSHNPPPYPYPASITIQALQQQLYASQQDTLALRQQAGQHIHELEVLVHTTWQRSNALEADVTHLAAELERANAYIVTAERDMRDLRMEAAKKEKQHCEALDQARTTAAARVVPPMQNSDTLLEHNRTTIRVLRAEIRGLKGGKKELQERLIKLGQGSEAMAGVRELPRWAEARVRGDVLEEWNGVLVGKERQIVGLQVMLEREREERAQMEKLRCTKCEPVLVVDDGEAE